jgi:class 3 adenylate cyclase/tetratricopeptide (TPR) repeat protein
MYSGRLQTESPCLPTTLLCTFDEAEDSASACVFFPFPSSEDLRLILPKLSRNSGLKCPKCMAENSETGLFCAECGAKLERTCSDCGFHSPPSAKFCSECGHDLRQPVQTSPIDYGKPQSYAPKHLADKILTTRSSVEGERKLVTVLFADLADYTSISEKFDPEEVHQIMEGYFRIVVDEIHGYEGTIDKFTGDGVMALFGAPLAHEDHARRACHAALSIQSAVTGYGAKIKEVRGVDFKMRLGLNSGPVIVGTIGDDLKMDYTAIGDTTNLASRMETMARPGSVMVSGNTHRLVRDYFEFVSLGRVEVKGKEKPQEAYELVRPSEVETRIEASAARGLTRFVGRGKDLEVLREACGEARSGSGQIVGIVGEAGVGKSRLILELRKAVSRDEYTCLQGLCLHYGSSMPYLPILDILKSYFKIEEEDREYMVKRKEREGLTRLHEKLLGYLPSFHELLSVQVDDERYLQLDPQQRRQRAFEAIRDLLIRLSQDKPLLLIVEDVHWIDKTSQEFLDYLVGRLANTRILLLLLYRPEYTHTWGSKSYYAQISLDQLSARNSADLVQAILEEGEVVPELRDVILGRAGGNPLFVEELTHSLLENGSIHRKDDHYVLAKKPSEIQVPDTIQGIIAARMDRLEESLKRIMQVASVIGREFAYRILQTVTGMREELKGSLVNLQGLEFIYEKQLFPELEYFFKHALTQEVAYNSLLHKKRKEIHEKIGRAIEQIYAERLEEYYELLAHHYVRSDNTVKTVEYLDLANQKAVKAHAMEDAKAYFDQAMEVLDTLPETEENKERRISLVLNQHLVFFKLLKLKEYEELLARHESMAAEIRDRGVQGAFYARMGYWDFLFGQLDRAIETGTKGVDLCEAAGYPEETGFAYLTLATTHLWRGDYESVLALKERALRVMEGGFHLRNHVRPLLISSYACTELGRWDEAVELGRNALEAAREFGANNLISWSAWTLCLAHTCKRDMEKAIEYGELALGTAHNPGDKVAAQGPVASAWCHAGDPERSIEALTGLIPLAQAAGFVSAVIPNMHYLAQGYWLAGQFDKAGETASQLLELAERCGARGHVGKAHRLLGEVALKTDPDEGGPHFDQAISLFRETKAENELALAYAGYGRLHKQLGNVADARGYLTQALEIFERIGTLIEPDKVRQELAELPKEG